MAEAFPIDIVVSAGAAETAVARFDRSLDGLEKRSAAINSQLKLVVDSSSDLGRNSGGAAKLASDLDKVESEARETAKQLKAVEKSEATIGRQGGGERLADDLNNVKKPAEQAAEAVQNLGRRVGLYLAAATGAAAAAAAVSVIKQGDAYALLEDRIRRATAATGDFLQVRNEIFDIAFQSGQSIDTVNKVFESINRSRNELKASTDDILNVTRAVQQLGVISGATRTETQNALRQLSQGFSSDFLRAEEFNSILENTPEIAFRIAEGMNISLGSLQALVRSGKVLSKDVFASILKQSEDINATLEDAPVRLERAFAQLGQSTDAYFASLDASFGEQRLSEGLAEDVSTAATLLQGFVKAGNQLNEIQRSVKNQLVLARADLAELQSTAPLFYQDRHEAVIAATEAEIAGLEAQIEKQQELDRIERGVAARKATELENAQLVAAAIKNQEQQEKNLSAVRVQLQTATERLVAEEEKRAQIIRDNPLAASTQTDELLERSRQKLADGLAKIREQEERAEQQSANKIFQIRLKLADESEKLRLQEQRRQELITNNVSDVTLRDELLLESAQKLEQELEAIEQRKADKQAQRSEEFLEQLERDAEAYLDNIRERNELEEELRLENELRKLEGRQQATDIEDLDELNRLERHEEAKLAIILRYNRIAQRGRQITAKFEETIERNKTQAIIGLAYDLTSQLAGQSKTLFEINKVAGIANAIVNTAQGVTEALKLPYPLNLVAAASTLAVGVGQIATIRSATYGGGGSIGGGVGGGIGSAPAINIPEALTVTGDTQTEAATQSAPTVVVQTQAIFTNDAQEMQEVLGPAALQFIREETTEGDATPIQVGSRQSLDLTQ